MKPTTPLTDRRGFPRRDIRNAGIRAWLFPELCHRQRCLVVEVSKKGILVKSSQILVPGDILQVAIAYQREAGVTRLLRRWTRVTRQTANGFAAVFISQPHQARRR